MPVYMILVGERGPVKIGHSNDPRTRLRELQVAHHRKLTILRKFEGGEVEERLLHDKFEHLRLRGEWFRFSKKMLGDVGLTEILPAPVVDPLAPSPSPFTAAINEVTRQWVARAKQREALTSGRSQ